MPSCGRGGFGKRLLELSDIEVEGRDGVPVQCVRVSREELLNCGKCLAQLVEQLAQVIASLSLGCVGPEEEGKMLAMLRNIAMQYEIGEQGLQAHGVEACHLPVSVDQAEVAEQSDVKGWLHRDLLDSRFSNERTNYTFFSESAHVVPRGFQIEWCSPSCEKHTHHSRCWPAIRPGAQEGRRAVLRAPGMSLETGEERYTSVEIGRLEA